MLGFLLWRSPFYRSLATATQSGSAMHITAEEAAAARAVKPSADPVRKEIDAYRLKVRALYNDRKFDDLEKEAIELRKSKETFRNGSWKIVQFYTSLECGEKEPESMWKLHEQIHRDWIAAYPASVTARVAQAEFFVNYAWHARGSDYADKVTQDGWKLFGDRLVAARTTLEESRNFPEKDPYWWRVGLTVALGQEWPKPVYDHLVEEAQQFEPKFWGYQTARAYSLLPRWYGRPGEWETYASQAAANPDGLGPEIYARIVMNLRHFYGNIFQESNASWPKTRDGLALLRQKYPDTLEFTSETALLAASAQDRPVAQAAFQELGDTYLPEVWHRPDLYAHVRHWVETGEWGK